MVILLGLEAHVLSVKLVDNHLYVANPIDTYALPSTAVGLKEKGKDVVSHLFAFKVG